MLSGSRALPTVSSKRATSSVSLPDFVDPMLREVELPPYLQSEECDVSLLELSALLSDKNATLACMKQAATMNFSMLTSGLVDEQCVRLFALTARMMMQNSSGNASAEVDSLYSMPAKVFIMSATVLVSLITVFGNAVVLLSFVIERSLRQATNYFIASLAVTDLLIGLFSMNFFSLYLILDNHWPLGDIICDLWLSLDFTVCLASQYTVFFITVDRFCSVKFPAKYRGWRSDQKVLCMVLGSWILPTAVFFPIILGWPFFNHRKRLEHQCEAEFIWDPWLTLWLTVGYYWITLIAMTSLYVVIYRVAVQMSKKADEKRKRVSAVFQLAEKSVVRLQVCMTQNLSVSDNPSKPDKKHSHSHSHSHSVNANSAMHGSTMSRSSRCDSLFDNENDSDNENENTVMQQEEVESGVDRSALCNAMRDAASQQFSTIGATQSSTNTNSDTNTNNSTYHSSLRGKKTRFSAETSESKRSMSRQMTIDVDTDRDSGTIVSPAEVRRESKMQLKSSRFQALAKRVSGARKKNVGQTQKAENRAKKALRTITFILGCFVACWTPYHVVILIDSFAKLWFGESIVNAHVYNFSYWLCYLNSPINPFCYAFVNVQFKKAFLRILKLDWTIK